MYHMALRTSALALALLLLFDSGFVSPITKELSDGAQRYLANAVGATASVEPTDLSMMTAELTERQRELDARETALSEREMNIGLGTTGGGTDGSDISTYILSVLLFIILVLIVLNYALDFARQRRLSFLEVHESR